jgi:hypothetical protein
MHWERLVRSARAVLGLSLAMLIATGADALADDISKFPGFAEAELTPSRSVECGELRPILQRLPDLDRRVDLWAVGKLVGVQTDDALWFLVICALPDVRILCVTYESNGMKVGDRVYLRGAYERKDDHHVLLDPCLASWAEQGAVQ